MLEKTQPTLLLTKQTFVAVTDGVLIFLDLHNDTYSCLERKHTAPIAALLDLPVDATDRIRAVGADAGASNNEVAEIIEGMIENGIATRDSKIGKRASFVSQNAELREMLGYVPGEGPKVSIGHVLSFFKSLIVTKWLLRFGSMEHTVTRVKRRKERFRAQGGVEPSYERIHELVEIYKILKPLFVTVKDECLFNSLFLIEFLACYRVYPSWYFGVRLNEFYAHCWVQDRNVLYDDFIFNTCQNQPIMVV